MYETLLLAHIFSVFSGTFFSWRVASRSPLQSIKKYRLFLLASFAILFATGFALYLPNATELNHSSLFKAKILLTTSLLVLLAVRERSSLAPFGWILIMLVSIGERAPLATLPFAILFVFLFYRQARLLQNPARS